MDPAWAVGALGRWALILGARGLGNGTCILGLGRGSLLGLVAPFLLCLSQAPADGGRGVTWVGSGWVCPTALFWARLAGRAWPRPTDFASPGVGSCLWAVVPMLIMSCFHLLGSRHPCDLGHNGWPSRGSARWGWEWLPPPPKAGHLLRLPRMGHPSFCKTDCWGSFCLSSCLLADVHSDSAPPCPCCLFPRR